MLLSILILSLGLVSDVALGSSIHQRVVRRHASLAARRSLQPVEEVVSSNSTPVEFNEQQQQQPTRRRKSKRCKVPPPSASSQPAASSPPKASAKPVVNTADKPKPAPAQDDKPKPKASAPAAAAPAPPKQQNQPAPAMSGGSKLSQIKNMHAFAGFVYAVSSCPSKSKAASDFANMKKMGARTAITFDICQGQDQQTFYGNMIAAAQQAGIMIIPLIPTLSTNIDGNMNAIVNAVKANPGPVLAVALGDEPLFDNDFGNVGNVVSHINTIKSSLSSHGIPVSISDMAYGWQQAGDISSLANAVDFFMMNNFPYFAGNAGNGDNAWGAFKNDISYFQKISQGKPLLVTQTGWPSNKNEFPSQSATASVAMEQKFFQLLNSHCADFFKPNNIGWMWRSYDDSITGWGVLDGSGNQKFALNAVTSC
jgi:exo-beta-1,3-glucanase (GH17 family)